MEHASTSAKGSRDHFYFNFLNTLLFLGYSVSQWVSLYRPCQEDRIHSFKCRHLMIGSGQVHCSPGKSLNAPKQAFSFTCPQNGFITEVSSHFDKASKDRRYCVCFSNIRPALISASCNCPSLLQHFSLPSDQLPHLVCLVPSHSFIGAEENKRGRLVFCFPAPLACTFSSSHQPSASANTSSLLTCSPVHLHSLSPRKAHAGGSRLAFSPARHAKSLGETK